MKLKTTTNVYDFTGAKSKVISALRSEGFVVAGPFNPDNCYQKYDISNRQGQMVGELELVKGGFHRLPADAERRLIVCGNPLPSSKLEDFARNYQPKK